MMRGVDGHDDELIDIVMSLLYGWWGGVHQWCVVEQLTSSD
jgi:hypothetical protein